MSKQFGIGLAAIAAIALVALTYFFVFGNKTPAEEDVRRAVAAVLPADARIDGLTFESFPDDRASGRVSVTGTFSFGTDIFSQPTPPQMLLNALSADSIYDSEVTLWWTENSGTYPQFQGKLAEYRRVYSSGESLPFRGELPYLAVVDGVNVSNSGLDFRRIDGTPQPGFGYLAEAETVNVLRAEIVAWRDRKAAEELARREAEQAQRLARELEAARIAKEQAVAEAEAQVAAAAVAAQIAKEQAVAEAEAQVAAEAAARKAYDESFSLAEVGPCLRENTDKEDCNTVKFEAYTYYDRYAPPGHCVMRTADGLELIPLGEGSGWWRYRTETPVVSQFFTAPASECG